jgi:hypothetical protein
MSEGLEREEVHRVVDRAVEELLEAAGVHEPPVNAVLIARKHLGLVLSLDEPRRGRSRSVSPRPEPTEERRQWTAAGAIGEHLKADLLRRLGIDPEEPRPMSGESLATLFAQRLLTPTRWLAAAGRTTGYDLPALKEQFASASHEVIALRLLDLPEPCIIAIIDNEHVYRRRSNAWRINRELSEAEKHCQEYVHRFSRPHRLLEEGWTVQGWPIHEVDWKREVLRSVVEE